LVRFKPYGSYFKKDKVKKIYKNLPLSHNKKKDRTYEENGREE
jgi:hypothetical protein